MQTIDFTYETKCRICGTITDWYFSNSDNFTWIRFAEGMQDYIDHPRSYECKKCKKHTVQDVVSYTQPSKN